jgi:hypothetical protein
MATLEGCRSSRPSSRPRALTRRRFEQTADHIRPYAVAHEELVRSWQSRRLATPSSTPPRRSPAGQHGVDFWTEPAEPFTLIISERPISATPARNEGQQAGSQHVRLEPAVGFWIPGTDSRRYERQTVGERLRDDRAISRLEPRPQHVLPVGLRCFRAPSDNCWPKNGTVSEVSRNSTTPSGHFTLQRMMNGVSRTAQACLVTASPPSCHIS